MTENRVVAEGVHKAFGDNKVLKGVSFTVEQGTATAIIGPSGSGKTTLLRTLNALDRADAGVIRVDDIEIDFSTPTPKPEVRRFQSRSGFVFQNHNLFPHKTVLENVMLAPVHVKKMEKGRTEALAKERIGKVGLADKVVFMADGRILEEGKPEEIFSNPKTPEARQFLRSVL